MVQRKVAVIATMANNAAVAAKATTTTIPIDYRRELSFQRHSDKNAGDAARADTESRANCRAGEPHQSKCRSGRERGRGGRPCARAGAPAIEGKERTRDRRRFRAPGGRACRSA